jgi:hypothetical protein
MSHAPYSPELSGAEPHIRRIHAHAFLAAINMSLEIEKCWRILFIGAVLHHGRDLFRGHAKASAALYGGPELAGGHQIALLFDTMKLVTTRDIYVIPDAQARPITLALNNTAKPSGGLLQPDQDQFDARLSFDGLKCSTFVSTRQAPPWRSKCSQ